MEAGRFETSPIGRLIPIRGHDGRFGVDYDHVAFVPVPLGGQPVLTGETWRMVSTATAAVARLEQASRQLPNPGLLRRPTLRREAQSTSALEGTFAPLEDVLSEEQEEASAELIEVLNYVRAAELAFASLERQGTISAGLLEASHRVLMAGRQIRDIGQVRSSQVAIGSATGAIEDARFVPMPPGPDLREAFNALIQWIRNAERVEPIVAAALAHYQFETLHPFNDGNGRIGRLLIVLQLMSAKVLSVPLLSVSPWFEARRTEYQDQLAAVSATGNWDQWVLFFTRGIAASADDTLERANRLLDIRENHHRILQQHNVVGGIARDIVELLIAYPNVTISMVEHRVHKTPQAVGRALQRLVEVGILKGPYGQYRKRYIAKDVMDVLSAPLGRLPSRRVQ